MVIGIDASRANAREKTGTEWYSFHVIQELKMRIPSTHHVILYSKEPLIGELAELPEHWESRVLKWRPKFLWTQLRLSIEMLFHKPDLLYIPTHTIPVVHPKNIVVVIHDVGFERQHELYDTKQIGYNMPFAKKLINFSVRLVTLGRYGSSEYDYHRFAVRLAEKHATDIITVSHFSAEEIQEIYSIENERITVIPNGLNERVALAEDAEAVLNHFGIHKPYILFIGRIEQKKNVPALIDAFALLQSKYQSEYGYTCQLVLAGSPGYQYDMVQERIKEHGLEKSVIETGWIEDTALGSILKEATVFVFPSLYEGFGIPILEAMQMGVPVVCSDIPALREVGGDAVQLFDPHDPHSIATSLSQLIQYEAEQRALIQKGFERITHFSWSKTALQTWEVLERYTHE